MTKIAIPRAVVEQALHVATGAGYPLALIAALKAALSEPQEPGFWGRVAARQATRIKRLETTGQQALEAMEREAEYFLQEHSEYNEVLLPAIEALKAALAEPVQDGFDQLIAEMEADPEGAQALEEGRRWVNEQFYAGAEPVQEPVAFMDAPERIYLQVCEDDHCEVPFHEHDEKTWCTTKQNPLDVPYVRADLAAPLQRKPLTGVEIEKAYREIWRDLPSDFDHTSSGWIEQGVRYAERAHGIT
jgi:hypothetical protein